MNTIVSLNPPPGYQVKPGMTDSDNLRHPSLTICDPMQQANPHPVMPDLIWHPESVQQENATFY